MVVIVIIDWKTDMFLNDVLRLGEISFHLQVFVEVLAVTTHNREIDRMGNIGGVLAFWIRAIGALEAITKVCYAGFSRRIIV
jgi:hypothetical protein